MFKNYSSLMAEKFRFLKRFHLRVGDTFTGTDTSANFFKQCLFRINLGRWKHIRRGNSTLNFRRIWCVIFIYNPYFTLGINWIYIIHRPGDDPARNAIAAHAQDFLAYDECFRRVHSLTTRWSTCLMSSVLCTNIAVCRSYQNSPLNPPPIASSPPHST